MLGLLFAGFDGVLDCFNWWDWFDVFGILFYCLFVEIIENRILVLCFVLLWIGRSREEVH